MELLFKFLTTREVQFNEHAKSSGQVIKRRKIRVVFMLNGQYEDSSITFCIVPSMAPIDHTFRFFQPEMSEYEVLLPPFIELKQPGLSVLISDPGSTVDLIPDTNVVRIRGKTGEA